MSIITLIKKFDPDNNAKHGFIFMQTTCSFLPIMFIMIASTDFTHLGAQGLVFLASIIFVGITIVNTQRYREKKHEDDCWNI